VTTTTLILARHGQTDHNLHQRYQGQSDVPMNDTGRAQVRAAARHLAGVQAAAIYTSDLTRCRETANIIGAALGLEPVIVPALRERSFGRLEGLTHEEAAARFPESWAQRLRARDDSEGWIPPAGESLADMWGRVLDSVRPLWERHEGQTFIIAAHAGPLKTIICEALGAGVETRSAFVAANGSISVVTQEATRPAVSLLNETCHLKGLPADAEAD